MVRSIKIGRIVGIALVLVLGLLALRAVRGVIVQTSSYSPHGPVIKVRMLPRTPWTPDGFLGIGDVVYRGEYYVGPRSEMSSSIVFSDDSLLAGNKIEIKWHGENRAEVAMDDEAIFHWTGDEWRKWGIRK